MQSIGVLGAGHLGKIHLNCILQSARFDLRGFYEPDPAKRAEASEKFGVPAFDSAEALIEACEVVDIVTPTSTHFALAKQVLEAGRHLFVEKPVTRTLAEAEELLALQARHGLKVQVGHVERFNPAYLAIKGMELSPMFVEAHRLATFNPRGTDVSVVLDLMIHDIDILLHLVKSEVTYVSASAVAVVSQSPDISNAHIEFANGCVANLTASRMSLKQMRKVRFFQKDAYVSLDFLDKQAQIVRLYDQAQPEGGAQTMELPTPEGTRYISMEMPELSPVNAIKMELESLADSIEKDTPPVVSLHDGYRALRLAYDIIESAQQRSRLY